MGRTILKLTVIVLAVYLGMRYIFPVVLPFLIAFIIAKILYRPSVKLEKVFRGRRMIARSLMYTSFLLALFLACGGIVYLCYRMGCSCIENFDFIQNEIRVISDDCFERVETISGLDSDEIGAKLSDGLRIVTDGAVKISKKAGSYLVSFLANALVTLVAGFLLLQEYERTMELFQKTWAGKQAFEILGNMRDAFGAYLKAQICIISVITTVCVVGMFLIRIPMAFVVGIAIGLFDALPFLGTGTILVPWAVIEVLLGEYAKATGLLVIYVICTIIRQLLEPRLVGKKLGIPPLVVLMSLYIGIRIYGGVGVIFGPISILLIYEIWKMMKNEKI